MHAKAKINRINVNRKWNSQKKVTVRLIYYSPHIKHQ